MPSSALSAVFLLLLVNHSTATNTFVSNTFGNEMVLQRAPAAAVVYGISNTSNSTVTTVMGSTRLITKAGPDGIWRQRLPPMNATLAGTNFTFTSSSGEMAQLTGNRSHLQPIESKQH